MGEPIIAIVEITSIGKLCWWMAAYNHLMMCPLVALMANVDIKRESRGANDEQQNETLDIM